VELAEVVELPLDVLVLPVDADVVPNEELVDVVEVVAAEAP
jgi:hypothetical protein